MQERGNKGFRAIDRWVGVPLVFLLGAVRRRHPLPPSPATIGLLMLGAVGDTLIAAAVLDDLRRRYPAARLILFYSPASKAAAEIVDGADDIVGLPLTAPHRAVAILRRRRLDLLIDFGQWPRISALYAALSGCRHAIGFRKAGQYRHFAYDQAVEHRADRHEVDNFRALLAPLGITAVAPPRLRAELRDQALPPGLSPPYVVFHPWASGFRHHLREWPRDRWRDLGQALIERGLTVVISGGPSDQEESRRLAAAIDGGDRVVVLAGNCSLARMVAVLAGAATTVAVNTGTMHLAALAGCPLVALHGPTDPNRWGPLGGRSVVLGPGKDRGGAYLDLGFEYPDAAAEIMTGIETTEVLDATLALIAAPSPSSCARQSSS